MVFCMQPSHQSLHHSPQLSPENSFDLMLEAAAEAAAKKSEAVRYNKYSKLDHVINNMLYAVHNPHSSAAIIYITKPNKKLKYCNIIFTTN